MADLPWTAFTSVRAGAFKTLSALWRHLSGEDLWAARAEGRRPWVCPTVKTLMARTGRCRRSVEGDLTRLRAAGWVERAWGELGGRRVHGLRLADPEGVDAGLMLAPVGGDTEETCGVTPQELAGSDRTLPRSAVSGSPRPTSAERPSDHPHLLLLPAGACGVAADAAAAGAAPVAPRKNLRGHPAGSCGSDGLALSPEALVGILGEVHLPAPAQRIVADRPTLRRARALLAVPLEGRDEIDALEARRERFQEVLAIAMDFYEICQVEPDQLRWWCGQMLELEGQRRGDGVVGVSRWEHVEHLVAMRRAGRADERGAGAQA